MADAEGGGEEEGLRMGSGGGVVGTRTRKAQAERRRRCGSGVSRLLLALKRSKVRRRRVVGRESSFSQPGGSRSRSTWRPPRRVAQHQLQRPRLSQLQFRPRPALAGCLEGTEVTRTSRGTSEDQMRLDVWRLLGTSGWKRGDRTRARTVSRGLGSSAVPGAADAPAGITQRTTLVVYAPIVEEVACEVNDGKVQLDLSQWTQRQSPDRLRASSESTER